MVGWWLSFHGHQQFVISLQIHVIWRFLRFSVVLQLTDLIKCWWHCTAGQLLNSALLSTLWMQFLNAIFSSFNLSYPHIYFGCWSSSFKIKTLCISPFTEEKRWIVSMFLQATIRSQYTLESGQLSFVYQQLVWILQYYYLCLFAQDDTCIYLYLVEKIQFIF